MRPVFTLIVSLVLLLHPLPAKAGGLFTKGVNLTGWFQAGSVRDIEFAKFTEKDLREIKSLGCDVIRLPINLHAMTRGAPEYKIDPLFFLFLDEVVGTCETLDLALILDNHTFDPAVSTKASVEEVLLKVWGQMAERYADRGDFLYYEILNEPHGLAPDIWGKIQLNVLKKIRQIDQKHIVIVGGANWNDIDSLYLLPDFEDDRIIYTFHFYDPFIFTHQGADWTEPSLKSLQGVPYPYDPKKMPSFPKKLSNTWIWNSFKYDYPLNGNNEALEKLLTKVVEFRNQTGKPVFCGEFGVYNQNSCNEDRVYWYESVRKILEKYSIPWTSWDYRDRFGLFEKDSSELFEYDLNLPLLRALGFNEVPQAEFKLEPETGGFELFNQYPAQGMFVYNYLSKGIIDLYDDTVLDERKFAIRMENLGRYNYLHFGFKLRKDLSLLLERDYNLVIKIKVNPNFQDVDLRFLAIHEDDPLAIPWRMGYTLTAKSLQNTFDWQTVTIPLANFTERGAWKGKWYDSKGLFDWSQVIAFEVAAENGNWQNTGICIGEIRIAEAMESEL